MSRNHNGNNVAGTGGRNCDCVYECLLELIQDALGENNQCGRNNSNVAGAGGRRNCDFVFECLEELLEDALDPCRRR